MPYIDREQALSHPFANGRYDHKHANEHFILGFEDYKEWLKQLPTADVVDKKLYDRLLENAIIISAALNNYQTADMVEVVRCKDCKWGKEVCGNIECFVDLNAPTEYHGYDWFCPNGERRDDG